MSGSSDLPPRPAPPRRPVDVAGAWITWFGVGRLIAAAGCVLIVGAGAYWLVRSPIPPAEAQLPFASSTSAGSVATLAPPVGPPQAELVEPVGQVVVHVAGAVRAPGVYVLDLGDRVHDAVAAAGGAGDTADLEGLNLAAALVDGGRVYVPVVGEIDPATVPSRAPGVAAGPSSLGPIDVNRATAAEFEMLPGVGPATAAAIVDDRERNGPFASVDDLDRVPGIGPAKLSALRDLVSV
jgi:competence protein ComEA